MGIAPPYAISALPPATDAYLRSQLAGRLTAGMTLGVASITKSDAVVALMLVVRTPGSDLTPKQFDLILQAIAAGTNAPTKTQVIGGRQVTFARDQNTPFSLHRNGSDLVIVVEAAAGELLPSTKALIARESAAQATPRPSATQARSPDPAASVLASRISDTEDQ
jgi:hypothetical protein